jgi:hypothetical protein
MTNRDRIVVGVLACVAAFAGFWFLALKPKRAEADAAAARAAQAQTQLTTANDALASAAAARASFERDYATIAALGKAVPEDDDAASLVFQIEATARKAGIDFRSLSVGGGAAAAAAPAPAQGTDAKATDTSKTDSSSSSSAPAAPTGTSTLPPGVVAGTDGMNRLPFTFVFDGDYFALTKLLDLLHSFTTAKGDAVTVRGRLMTVEAVNLEQSRNGFPEVKATVTATAYLSSEPVQIPGATPAQQATTPAPQPQTTAPSTQAAGGGSSLPAATVTPGVAR